MTMSEWRTVLVCGENVQFPKRKSGFFTEEFEFKGTTHLLQFKDDHTSPMPCTRYYVDGVECEYQTPQAFTQYFIALHSLTAWQYCNWVAYLDAAVDTSRIYTVCDTKFHVYRASDGTCWQYYSEGDDYYHYSPWYESAVVEPNKEHFGQWVASTVQVSK